MITLLFTLFFLKHFLVDFPLQFPRHYLNKGTYGNYKGFEHSMLHGIATMVVLFLFFPLGVAILFGLVDMFLHYHIDWAKMNINKRYNLKPDNSEKFWWLLGLDQLLHCLTYAGIIACLT